MTRNNRDEFTEKTKLQIAKRAGFWCSDPACRRPTVGATSDGASEINEGIAAHICAASPGGPRFDPEMTTAERRSTNNGIWMCALHGTSIDTKDPKYTVDLLRDWKNRAQEHSRNLVLYGQVPPTIPINDANDPIQKVRHAANADLAVFRRSPKWPPTDVELNLVLPKFDQPIGTNDVARALGTLGDLVIVAPPGMGKTCALFQIAEGLARLEKIVPIILPLADWATESTTILESISSRSTFENVSFGELRATIASGKLVLLLDGWNELDISSRKRARAQLDRLQLEYPQVGLVLTTRQQALDVPFDGMIAKIAPLNWNQQNKISIELRGAFGKELLERALNEAGIRELISIPLYLKALLSLQDSDVFPTTKEELLRSFVDQHEADPSRQELLNETMHGTHHAYLCGLALASARLGIIAFKEVDARRVVSETSRELVRDGQIATAPQPKAVIDALVAHHLLVRSAAPSGITFQHQQFQEWYSSQHIIDLIREAASNDETRNALQCNYFNYVNWEEAIFFAFERLSRGSDIDLQACGQALEAAFEVDPLLAAEIVFRGSDELWEKTGGVIRSKLIRWHKPNQVDRAFRAMLTTGKPDFLKQIWPLLGHDDSQVHLKALRHCRRFRVSCLGPKVSTLINTLPSKTRSNVLYEIVLNGGLEGQDLAVQIARSESDDELTVSVVDALDFRNADRQLKNLLESTTDNVFDLLIKRQYPYRVFNQNIEARFRAARSREQNSDDVAYKQLYQIAFSKLEDNSPKIIEDIISTIGITDKDDPTIRLIYNLNRIYPEAVSNGIVKRLIHGFPLFWGADNIFAASGIIRDDDQIFAIASKYPGRDASFEAAASILGSKSVEKLLEHYDTLCARLWKEPRKRDEALSNERRAFSQRLAHCPGSSLIVALQNRSISASIERKCRYADLISRHPDEAPDRGRPFSSCDKEIIGTLFEQWSQEALNSDDTSRYQLAELTRLVNRAPSNDRLATIKEMLDRNLDGYRASRSAAVEAKWRPGAYPDDAHHPHTGAYQNALMAIGTPDAAKLASGYLIDEHFGECAGRVLMVGWIESNEPKPDRFMFGGIDFTGVVKKRHERANGPEKTCWASETIFAAIQSLLRKNSTESEINLAVTLGVFAARLPYGQKKRVLLDLVRRAGRRSRCAILQNMILSGEEVDTNLVIAGIDEVYEDAKEKGWVLTDSEGYQIREWTTLIPFTTAPKSAMKRLEQMPEDHRRPRRLESMVHGLRLATSKDAESCLFALPHLDDNFYDDYAWQSAVFGLGSSSAARELVELTAQGIFNKRRIDGYRLNELLGSYFEVAPELRQEICTRLRDEPNLPGFKRLAGALANNPDSASVMALIHIEQKCKLNFLSLRTLETLVTQRIPSENWKGAFDIIPVPAGPLRTALLDATAKGDHDDKAAFWLNKIDTIWDGTGWPPGEPRHPNLASQKPWPIIL